MIRCIGESKRGSRIRQRIKRAELEENSSFSLAQVRSLSNQQTEIKKRYYNM